MAYPTPNTDAALAKVPEAVQADIKLAFKKALEEGRLHDAASIATEQNNPLMAQEVLDVNKEHSETSNDDTPPSGGASIDQISTLLDTKMTPLVDILPKDDDGKLIPAASQAEVDDHAGRIENVERRLEEHDAILTEVKAASPASSGQQYNFRVAGIAAVVVFIVAMAVFLIVTNAIWTIALMWSAILALTVGAIAGALTSRAKTKKDTEAEDAQQD